MTPHLQHKLETEAGCLLTAVTRGWFFPLWILIALSQAATPWECDVCGTTRVGSGVGHVIALIFATIGKVLLAVLVLGLIFWQDLKPPTDPAGQRPGRSAAAAQEHSELTVKLIEELARTDSDGRLYSVTGSHVDGDSACVVVHNAWHELGQSAQLARLRSLTEFWRRATRRESALLTLRDESERMVGGWSADESYYLYDK